MSAIYFGLSPTEVRTLAYQCAVTYDIIVPNSWQKNKKAGPDWFIAFLKKNGELSIRTLESRNLARASSFNRHNVSIFF